jgi:hypothetical protein
MVQMVEKFSFNMDDSIKETSNTGKPTVVLITGTSGNLGSQILVNLAENNAAHRIHALNRTSSGCQSISERHKGRFDNMALNYGVLNFEKLVHIDGDTSEEGPGLKQGVYEEVSLLKISCSDNISSMAFIALGGWTST